MKKIRRTMCFLMAFCLLFGTLAIGASAAGKGFSDVATTDWFYDPVMKATEAGIVAGNANGTYAPNGTLTWAQTITFAVRLHQLKNGEKIYSSGDQTGKNWYDIYVDYAVDKGIINSAPATPNGTIIRADAAVIFSKVLGEYTKINEVEEGYFTDVRAAHHAHDAIYMLAEAGICNGKTGGVFGINDSFRRSEVAAIVARMAGLVDYVYIQTGAAQEFSLSLEGRVFRYTQSVVGGTTTITIGQGGSFSGQYLRHNTTETGANYAKGTIYLCNFTGRFVNAKDTGSMVQTMGITELKLSATPGSVVYKDGIRYIATEAYGLEDTTTVALYMSGNKTTDMPECLVNALVLTQKWGSFVPSRAAGLIIYNPVNHKVLVEDVAAGVSTAKLFAALKGKTFTYSANSGTTTITFGANGSFTGEYTSTSALETGKDYPMGTVYQSTFYGSFADATWRSDYQYAIRLNAPEYNEVIGSATVKNGVRYVAKASDAFKSAGYFVVYLPGANASNTRLDSYGTSQASFANALKAAAAVEKWNGSPSSMPCWTMYNVGGQNAFISYD